MSGFENKDMVTRRERWCKCRLGESPLLWVRGRRWKEKEKEKCASRVLRVERDEMRLSGSIFLNMSNEKTRQIGAFFSCVRENASI